MQLFIDVRSLNSRGQSPVYLCADRAGPSQLRELFKAGVKPNPNYGVEIRSLLSKVGREQ
jgi:hypothetical protein